MTIYGDILGRGYFPKELPPAFSTEDFSRYARTKAGRALLNVYSPPDNFTELVAFRLALPGESSLMIRPLSIPHPWAFAQLAVLVTKHFRRLLRKAGASKFSRSRPVYATGQQRAMRTLVKPSNLGRERARARAGATHLLKIDISQFYPSLYTHAVGWAIDPALREKKNWNNWKLLGKKVDQCLMNMQGKVSQGVPIGNDISFLLAELVLSQVDKSLKTSESHSYRWFDDFEFACCSRQEAEETLVRLNRLLDSYRLRLNPKKTRIIELPHPAGSGWQDELRALSKTSFLSTANMVSYFDHAFRSRTTFSDDPVLMYAIGALFKARPPSLDVQAIAESCITQAVLAEPGCAQKAFALLTFWELNGSLFTRPLLADTIDRLIQLHESRGVSSDVAWALAFCIEHGVRLSTKSGRLLSRLEDDAVAIQTLHANSKGLVPGFSAKALAKELKGATCDGNHWLLLYEAVRQGLIPSLQSSVSSNTLFNDFASKGVAFYRLKLPAYASLVHPGGAPEWVIKTWLDAGARAKVEDVAAQPIAKMILEDLSKMEVTGKTIPDLARALVDRLTEHTLPDSEPYT